MAVDVVMPRLSDSMEEGTVLKWLVGPGDEVRRGQPLAEIETDKANMTYDADSDGVVIELVADEGATLAIGEVIARLGEAGAGAGADGGSAPGDRATAEPSTPEEGTEPQAGTREPPPERDAQTRPETGEPPARQGLAGPSTRRAGEGDGRIKASPVARRVARELGVELTAIAGSGPGGRIVKADVEAAAKGDGQAAPAEREAAPAVAPPTEEEAPAAEPVVAPEAPEPRPAEREPARAAPEAPPAEREPPAPIKAGAPARERVEAGGKGEAELHELTRLQRTVSRRMAESKATAPDFALTLDVDMTSAVELRARLKEVADPAPSFNDMVIKAAARALREHPRVNGAYRDGRWELYSSVNVGVAVAAEEALVVPTIFDADRKSLGEISRTARELVGKVRERTITPPELANGTFTVSNLGMYGIERFTAIINPPQAGLLTVGALMKKPVVDEDGSVVARDRMTLTLVCDHRILYGAEGARFLARVRELLERPLSLAL